MATCVCTLAICLLAWSCDRRLEEWVPLDEEPPPPAVPVRVPGLASPEVSEQVLAARDAPPPAAAAGASIRGHVRLGEGSAAGSGGVLFVIARSPQGGPPLAAVRLPGEGGFPRGFEIGPGNAMIPGRPLAGPVLLSARLDRDGDPLTRSPEDLVAVLEAPVLPGATDVDLVLAPAGPSS